MNKYTKGAIATAAGIVLLLGGAGTFALWSDNVGITGGTITSGDLDVALSGSAVWVDISDADPTPETININTFKIVPGDELQLTQDLAVQASGNNIKAELSYDSVVLSAYGSSVVATITVDGNALAPGDVLDITGDDTLTVVLTLAFAADDQDFQNVTGTLSDIDFTLTQVRP